MAIYKPLTRVLAGTLQGAIADLLAQAVPGGGGGGPAPTPVTGALIDNITWVGGHDFAAESGGSIPGINGTEVALANQSSRSYTKLSTTGFLERAIGTARYGSYALKPDGATYQFIGSADPVFDFPGNQDIHWRVVAVDDPDATGGFATWVQRRNGASGLHIERVGSSNSTAQPQFTVFQNTGSPVSFTGSVPSPAQNGVPLLLDFRQVASSGDMELSVNGFHSSSAAALTTPLPSFSNMTISALNSLVGGAVFIGVRHNESFSDDDHEIAWSNAVPAPRDGSAFTSKKQATGAGANHGSGLASGFSVSFWGRVNVGGTSSAEFCGAPSTGSWTNNWGFDRYSRPSGIKPTFWVNNWNGSTLVAGTAPTQGDWVHYVGTYDGDRMEIWQDGVLQAGLDGVSITSTSDSGIMTIRGVGGFTSNGADVVECGYWAGKALSSSEIALLATGVPVTDVSGCTHRWGTANGVDQVGSLDLS